MRLTLQRRQAHNALWLTLLISCLFNCVSARRFNVTIDDQGGDPTNGNQIIYTPSGAWQAGQNCTTCTAQPSQSDAYLGTWMDSTFNPNGTKTNDTPGQIIQASVSFTGTAVFVNCILTGSETQPNGNSDMTFILDGSTVGSFEKEPDGDTSYQFNQTVFSKKNLSNTAHTLQIQVGLEGQKALILLDSIVYTVNDSTGSSDSDSDSSSGNTSTDSSSSSHTGAIVGGVIGGLAVIGIIGAILYRRRRHGVYVYSSARAQLDGPDDRNDPQMRMAMNVRPLSTHIPSHTYESSVVSGSSYPLTPEPHAASSSSVGPYVQPSRRGVTPIQGSMGQPSSYAASEAEASEMPSSIPPPSYSVITGHFGVDVDNNMASGSAGSSSSGARLLDGSQSGSRQGGGMRVLNETTVPKNYVPDRKGRV